MDWSTLKNSKKLLLGTTNRKKLIELSAHLQPRGFDLLTLADMPSFIDVEETGTTFLENAKLKVIFGTGRQTAEAIARELYMPDPKAIKHEVVDETAKDRTHPIFTALADQFEVFTQSVQQLRQRRALVKLPDKTSVAHVRIPKVPASRLTAGQLERLKQALAKDVGTPYHVLEEQIARRAARHGVPFHLPQSRTQSAQPAPVAADDFWQ